ncbi:MAG: hypothetical protein D3910_15590, partial [Candidatus Electrothrix sp. ATG2]|nr:hypothetical protein [Candidatus Electrothrix sp. ATG2]
MIKQFLKKAGRKLKRLTNAKEKKKKIPSLSEQESLLAKEEHDNQSGQDACHADGKGQGSPGGGEPRPPR